MNQPVVVIGIGEIGSVIARGCLRLGYPVIPVRRNTDIEQLASDNPTPKMVLIAVGEKDLQPALETIPANWRDRLVLIQNELLPRDWAPYDFSQPTIASIWFEKKQGMDSKQVVPSVAYGPLATFLQQALAELSLDVEILSSEEDLLFQLVRKNLYILTSNIAGLKVGGDVQTLQTQHPTLMHQVAEDILDIQTYLTGTELDRHTLIQSMLTAFAGDPAHQCMGRSAPARLERALTLAAEAGLETPTLKSIAEA